MSSVLDYDGSDAAVTVDDAAYYVRSFVVVRFAAIRGTLMTLSVQIFSPWNIARKLF